MQISGLIFIVVGIIIGIASYFIPNMEFFYIAAAGFVLYGIYKMIRGVLSKKLLGPEPKTNESKPGKEPSEDTTPCPKCGLKHYSHANYCQNCGTKLK